MLKLRLLTGPRAGRQLRVSDTKPVSIGRRKGRLRLHDSRVSKHHAEISFENDLWLLRDLGSANGTYVNRKKAQGLVELEPGDMVQMGRVLLKIVRCDGIGMDTQSSVMDELLDDDALESGAATLEPIADDDDFDLDALFNEPQEQADADRSEDSDAVPAIAAPERPEAGDAIDDDADDIDQTDEDIPEPIEVAFDEPVDDDDSFFADLGEATDTSDGIDVTVQEELAQDELADEADPFLGDEDEAPADEDTSDQISLEDESGMGPHSAGTTLLTSVPHDDLVIDEDDSSSGAFFEEDESVAFAEDPDDEAPAVVGLHLDHAPPQQPEPKLEAVEIEPEVEHEVEEQQQAEVVSASESEVAEDEVQTPAEADVDEQAEAQATDQEIDVVEFDHADTPEAIEPVVEEADAPIQAEAEALEDAPAGLEEEPAFELEPEIDLTAEIESEFADTFEVEPKPDPVAETQKPADVAEDGPDFDIDAAFDALSAGLDDSQVAPAIDLGTDADSDSLPAEHRVDDDTSSSLSEPDQIASEPDTTDSLVGSQLDVGFIKDALAKLEESQTPDAEPPSNETQPKASATPATPPPTIPPAAPSNDSYLKSPPPGLNPQSLNPPTEPRRSHPPHAGGSGKGRWFVSILLLLSVGGVGGWFISQNYDKLIAGRDDAGVSEPGGSISPASPGDPIAEPSQPGPSPSDPATPAVLVPQPNDDTTPQPTGGPDPFAAGPVVLGSDALDGLTSGADPNRQLDAPQQPTTGNPLNPATIVQPPIRPGTTNPAGNPATANPQPNLPGTDEPATVVDAPPARIVFLVDASGSLVDSLPQMVVWLNEALQTIEPNERFAVYFFKADEPIAIKPAGMLAPTREVLNQLKEDWLDPDAVPVFPSGRSNPAKAIAQAMTHNPTDLYLLSGDSFAMYKGGSTAEQSLELVNQAIGESDVRVHGVQFFYRGDDSVLETLANQTKGTFEFVRERVVPDAEPIDLLEELGGE